eukprot:TRINITY_DN154_c0_g1_i1.p1 TRINITY_DN154_c0_g1~~TRINITY_DN154_c0_g1_i1.p1  ORF type:complete len:452 (-),score=158.32 TRINITY_DN154_c0_g1_i1:48-1403(-)
MASQDKDTRANQFIDWVNSSPTHFHATETASKLLEAAGFKRILEKDKWDLKPLGKYYFTRNQSSICAFALGGQYQTGNGFIMVGAHTDSPNLKIKPKFSAEADGYLQVEIEPYGGGLWTTWFDRDLTIAGRAIIQEGDRFQSKLLRVDRPIMRIPTLAIHLDRDSGTKLEFNKQTQLFPILATSIQGTLNEQSDSQSIISKLVASELNCKVEDIRELELSVVDSQKSVIGGVFNEFIFSPRLDNLMMSFCSIMALIEATKDEASLKKESKVWSTFLFDNEEVGSQTAHGAASPMVTELVTRVTHTYELNEIAIRNSFLVSADMAHAVHPNYREKHDPLHKPAMHKGLVIKQNANQRYATTAQTAFYLREIAKRHNLMVQDFVVRNDSACGSTIGPIIAGNTGIRTIDVGNPQLSMHSIREMCATSDIANAIDLLRYFFLEFTELDTKLDLE